MRKALCLILKHRFRVVQEFGRESRRIKCERCGGDWAMNDYVRAFVPWDGNFEQLYRDFGYEILEPLPAWHSVPMEPFSWTELMAACRWPGVVAVTVSSIVGYTIIALGCAGYLPVFATSAASWALGRFLGQRAIDRAYERKCNSLRA